MTETTTLTIRDARDDERPAIAELTLAAYAEYATIMAPAAWAGLRAALVAALAAKGAAERIVAERAGALAGSVLLFAPDSDSYGERGESGDAPEIRLLAVADWARGQGVAAALLEECIRRARAAGAPAIGLHTSDSMAQAMRLYERRGFVRAPEGDFQADGTELVKSFRLPLA